MNTNRDNPDRQVRPGFLGSAPAGHGRTAGAAKALSEATAARFEQIKRDAEGV
ncbi:hypothetical protein OG735_05430 [Streptomyces sp. NBC_01210]|uniref:hypothetical protein n=1 Tax=Streptomyces sp. NBC_01210 TaxID=2903774 RepID=UPI002E12B8AA|nr:hypothetical protein OG735_05430 [Streptomyces sp. NBC_01210]